MFRFSTIAVAFVLSILCNAVSSEQRGVVQVKSESGEEVALYTGSHALLVGASDYRAGWPKLSGVKDDVRSVRRSLEERGFQVTVVEDPDSMNLRKAFNDFIKLYGHEENNRLLFYFAGHGHTLTLAYGGEMGYIVPVDAPNPSVDKSGFIEKSLDMQQMEVYAKRIQAKHALFMFDSCFSGSIFSLSRAIPEHISYKTGKPVRQFITSGSAEETVPDESIFRQQFLSALEGDADVNEDGYVTGAELGEFLQEKVVNYSYGTQHPQYGKIRHPNLDKGDFVFLSPEKSALGGTGPSTSTTSDDQSLAVEIAYWNSIKQSDDPAHFRAYLEDYPSGRFSKIARANLERLTSEATAASAAGEKETASAGSGQALSTESNKNQKREFNGSPGERLLDMILGTEPETPNPYGR